MSNLENQNNLDEQEIKNFEEVNVVNQEEERKEEKSVLWYFPYLLIFTTLLFFSVFGITYSIYKGDLDDNEITTDNVIFTYSDVDKVGNGIYLKDAVSISDDQGKMMVGSKQYFDFFVTATTKKTNLKYQILVKKDEISTLENDNVRIYLTRLIGSRELQLVFKTFSNLETKKINGKTYYVLYEKVLNSPLDNYTDSYRLRMWIKPGAKDYQDKKFSIKVDVRAEQVEG